MIRPIVAVLFLITFPMLLLANDKEVEKPLPKTTTEVNLQGAVKHTAGDVIVLEITPPADTRYAVPKVKAQLDQGPVEHDKGRILWWKPYDLTSGKIQVAVTTYYAGNFEIKPIPFEFEGKPVFESEEKSVLYDQVEGDKKDDDIYGPQSVALPKWVAVTGSILGLALMVALVMMIGKWLKKRGIFRIGVNEEKKLLPIEEFERKRKLIEKENYLDHEKYKKHYFGLSETAKKYLGQAWHFEAEDKTTRELARALEEIGMPQSMADQWRLIFEEMDVTKFTDQKPDTEKAAELSGRLSEMANSSWKLSPAYREHLEILKQEKNQATKAPTKQEPRV